MMGETPNRSVIRDLSVGSKVILGCILTAGMLLALIFGMADAPVAVGVVFCIGIAAAIFYYYYSHRP